MVLTALDPLYLALNFTLGFFGLLQGISPDDSPDYSPIPQGFSLLFLLYIDTWLILIRSGFAEQQAHLIN